MGNYIRNSKHKKSIRAIQLLSYLNLLCLMASVFVFIYYSLRDHASDGLAFFAITFLYMLSCALHGAIGVSLPNSGKFEYYKPAFYMFLLCDVVGIINGVKGLSLSERDLADKAPSVLYLLFFVISLCCDVVLLQFLSDKTPRYAATIAAIFYIIITLLNLATIVYSVIRKDKLDHPLSDKQYITNLMCNLTFLVTAVGTVIITRIKPSSYEKNEE